MPPPRGLARLSPRAGRGTTPVVAVLSILAIALAAPGEGVAQITQKRGDSVRVVRDQLHQLNIVTAELHPFRRQKAAIGQIAFNEDASTLVLTPFPGRVTRLIAKVGDTVKRGDPLFEIDSHEVVAAAERLHRRCRRRKQGALAAATRADRRESASRICTRARRSHSRTCNRRRPR